MLILTTLFYSAFVYIRSTQRSLKTRLLASTALQSLHRLCIQILYMFTQPGLFLTRRTTLTLYDAAVFLWNTNNASSLAAKLGNGT